MRLVMIILLTGICFLCRAQQQQLIKVISQEDRMPVAASVLLKGTTKGYSTDSIGVTTIAFPANGAFTLVISAMGYEEKETRITIPCCSDIVVIELERSEHEMEEVIVQSTRTSRRIANVPTRVEIVELEEIDEKNNMRPANVAMILHESTGIQVQQTSATSGNASIRIQGLDGRYTQLLKDGYANFGNFSSGLSILEIPPLDLKQVEIIKGPASTLYGGGAIAGVINFISRTPGTKPEYNFILNQSNIGQSNVGGFASARGKKLGYTMLALYNRSEAYDVDKDHFTEVPKSNEFTVHPKLFIYPNATTTISIGNSLTLAKRMGGDILVINNKEDASHPYFEKNKTMRNISSFELNKKLSEKKQLIAKQSFSVFDRAIEIPSHNFSGIDYNAFTDITYVVNDNKHDFVAGGNFVYNHFREKQGSTGNRDNTLKTTGLFAQHTWDATEKVKLETGLRVDAANYKNSLYTNTEVFVLPRVSLLVKYNSQWSTRIGGGMGYKTPTLFTEQTESIQYQDIAQLNQVKSERSYGGTADINFRTIIGHDLALTVNHMFFYTLINRPLVLESDNANNFQFKNSSEPVRSSGFETNARFTYKENFKLFLGYTFTDTRAKYLLGRQVLPLVPKNKINGALIYEKEDVIKLGLEGYFTDRQYLSNGTAAPQYWEFGFMAEKIFNGFSLYVNFENFTDTRQSRYKNVANGSHLNPAFDEIWTHTEGFVMNGGIKIKL